MQMKFGILGSGSWGTALAKILTDNGNTINWWFRNDETIALFNKRRHNPQYLQSAHFDVSKLKLNSSIEDVISDSQVIIIAVPSAYLGDVLKNIRHDAFGGKKILSAVKGILPEANVLLNDHLKSEFNVAIENYFAVLGPCHAEEVAQEKLSYLTFSGVDEIMCRNISMSFSTSYLKTIINKDIYGVQYAAVLKNIYAVGSGMAHGLDYGDNFLSVLIANSADEMAGFLRKAGIINAEVGYIDHSGTFGNMHTNYAASVYLGDLLVTCYSLFSRNRTFGNMIGKGYSVKAAQIEMSMVAEGYNASRCMHILNRSIGADMPIANAVYRILWENVPAYQAFSEIEPLLV